MKKLFILFFILFFVPAVSFSAVELDATGSGGVDIDKGGTNATTAAQARINLGVDPAGTDNSTNELTTDESAAIKGSASPSASNVFATMADVTSGAGDMLSTNNLSDVASAATSRANLGVVIGADVQAYNVNLTEWATTNPSANGLSLVSAADYAAMKVLLDIDDLITLSGVAAGAVNLGTFTGTTISDSGTIKEGMQELETAVESAGGHDAVTLASGVNALTLSSQEIGVDTTVEQLADLTAVNNAIIGYTSAGVLEAKSSLDIDVTLANEAPTADGHITLDTTNHSARIQAGGTDYTFAVPDNTMTFTNKTISGSSNTISNVPLGTATGVLNGAQVADGTLEADKLEATNSPTDNYIPSFDSASGGYTWIEAGSGSGDIEGVTAGTGLSGGGTTGTVTLNLADTAVTAGSYTAANVTIDAQGRITAAANGSGGSGTDTGDATIDGGTASTSSTDDTIDGGNAS